MNVTVDFTEQLLSQSYLVWYLFSKTQGCCSEETRVDADPTAKEKGTDHACQELQHKQNILSTCGSVKVERERSRQSGRKGLLGKMIQISL